MSGSTPGLKNRKLKKLTTADAPYPTEFKDLDPHQVERLDKLMLYCRRRIADAIAELKRAKFKHSYRVETFFRIPEGDPSTARDIAYCLAVYNRIVGVLLGHERLRFDGEPIGVILGFISIFGHKPYAMVWSLNPPERGEAGEVDLIRKRFFSRSWDDQARAIIHEIGHRFCGLEDKMYLHGQPARISRADALRNADTFASFAIPVPDSVRKRQSLPALAPKMPVPPNIPKREDAGDP